jgi:hypothetical protein
MKNNKKATKVQGTKIAKGTKVTLTNLSQTASTSKASKKVDTKKESDYKLQVLKRWANLKEEKGKIGYCLSFIKAQSEVLQLTNKEVKQINDWKKDASILTANLKANKAGKYSAWQIFQYMYKISK